MIPNFIIRHGGGDFHSKVNHEIHLKLSFVDLFQ